MSSTLERRASAGYRVGIAARAVAAIGGGYLLAALASTLLALVLPLARADAVIIATMLAFVVYTCAILWVFATASAARAWTGLLAACGLCAVLLWLARGAP